MTRSGPQMATSSSSGTGPAMDPEVSASAGPSRPPLRQNGKSGRPTLPPMPCADDVAALTERLGRPPEGDFEVCVRSAAGEPVVIRNDPFLRDGTPMPTRYWLVDPELRRAVSRLESAGGVR